MDDGFFFKFKIMFKRDDIVVRIGNNKGNHYSIGEFGRVIQSYENKYYTKICFSVAKELLPDNINIRLATPLEIIAYNQGITNINDIKDMNYEIY